MSSPAARFIEARRDPELVVLEGLHAVKHALRFNAELVELRTSDRAAMLALAQQLAPDLAATLDQRAETITTGEMGLAVTNPPHTGVIAIARRPDYELDRALTASGPAILLEDPRRLANFGACVRVAAAAGAAAVISLGGAEPWSPDALRGSAGLHFAVPVVAASELGEVDRTLVAIDPEGEDLWGAELPADPLLAFGTERDGLSEGLMERAAVRLRIPMQEGVSSLNLATSVAAVLFGRFRPEAG